MIIFYAFLILFPFFNYKKIFLFIKNFNLNIYLLYMVINKILLIKSKICVDVILFINLN